MITKIAVNTLFLSFSQITARLLGFIYFIFLARYLGVATFGIYNFTLAFIYNFIPVADFGLERLVLRDISREPDKISFYLPRLLPLRLLLSLLAYFGAILFGVILGQSVQQIFYLAVFGLFIFPYNITYLLSSFLNAQEKMKYMSLAIVFGQLLIFILGVIFVLLKFPLSVIFLTGFLGQSLVTLIFLFKAGSLGLPLGWIMDKKFFKEVIDQSWVFASVTIVSVLYLRLSILMVNFLRGAEATGLYSSGFRFIEAMILIPQSVALALFPLSARLFLEDKEKLAAIYKKGLVILLLLSLPFTLVLIFLPKLIVSIAYGQNYLATIPIFPVLGFSLVLFFLNVLSGNIIQNSPQFNKLLPLLLLKVVFTIIIFLILIPRYYILGAAWGVVLGEAFGLITENLFVYYILRKKR